MAVTTRVRFDCRFGGNGGDTALYSDLTSDQLATIVDLLLDYRNRIVPAGTLISVMARPHPDDDSGAGYRQIRAWRVARVVAYQADGGEALLYERLRPEPVADDDQPDGLVVLLTPDQLDSVRAGGVVRVDFPADLYGPALAVLIRLER